MYTGAVKIELANFNYQRGRPGYFTGIDIGLAQTLSRHIVLSAAQIKALGFSERRLGHLTKYGFLYRYRLLNSMGQFIQSVYTVGRTAASLLGLSAVNLTHPAKAQAMVAVNQVVVYLLHKAPSAKVDINLHRTVPAIVTINNTFGILAPRNGFDRAALMSCSLEQGIVVLPDRAQAAANLSVRYVFDDEMQDPFDLKFYKHTGINGLEQEPIFKN